ncbi:rubrerythrin-like domain-containing protein [Halorubrum aidingense]|uniref:rubrerythrin-like domain-containing protein n=1 Tax=Halorubrum aidingense TaxID=368623 RepID=UPI0026C91D87|nr:rubrerythrin-like domain-containing protein [Halorubrum aidingense]
MLYRLHCHLMTRDTIVASGTVGDQYECRDCLARLRTTENLALCPDCGGELENISKPRE